MENPYSRIKMSSVTEHANGAVSFEMETVSYKQAYDEAMANSNKLLNKMYKEDPSSFKFVILNLGKNGGSN